MSDAMDEKSRVLPIVVFVAACFLMLARVGWEVAEPLPVDTFKGLIYVRDFATVVPACILAVWALSRLRLPLVEKIAGLPGRIHPAIPILWLVAVCGLIAAFVLRRVPHIVDEATYLFQSQTYARGAWSRPIDETTPFLGAKLTMPLDGKHVGVFFPVWPIMMVPFTLVGVPWLLNPLLTGVLAAAIYAVAKWLFGKPAGRWALLLFVLSPFTYLQGSSFFGHVFVGTAVVCAVGFWLRHDKAHHPLLSGLLLGLVLCARPLTAITIGICLVAYALKCGDRRTVRLAGLAAGFVPGAIGFLSYNAIMTGNLLKTTHGQWGKESITVGTHVVKHLGINGVGLLVDGAVIPGFILLLGIFSLWHVKDAPVRFLWIASLVTMLAYSFYSYHGFSYGPRFFFDIYPLVCLAGGVTLSRWIEHADARAVRSAFVVAPVSLLVLLATKYAVFGQRGELYSRLDGIADRLERPAFVVVSLNEKYAGIDRLDPANATLSRNDPAHRENLFGTLAGGNLEMVETAVPDRFIYTFQLDTNELVLVRKPER